MSVNLNSNASQVNQANLNNQQLVVPQAPEQVAPQVAQTQAYAEPQQVDAQTYLSQLPNNSTANYVPPATEVYNPQVQNSQQQPVAVQEQPAEQPKSQPDFSPTVVDDPIVQDWPKYTPQDAIFGPKPYAMPEIILTNEKDTLSTSDKIAIGGGIGISALALLLAIVSKFRRS